ncbi:hypothetical protein HDV03_005023 [Kappamyces sp. JEL0829]|nr:hypothetical protein HDV03_005023 [Kappamyces sp. JEL0829]
MSKNPKKGEFGDDFSDQPFTILPEWNESEVLAEKWASKHAFEDGDQVFLPRSLRKCVESYKRICDIMPDVTPVVVSVSQIEESFLSASNVLAALQTTLEVKPSLHSKDESSRSLVAKSETSEQESSDHTETRLQSQAGDPREAACISGIGADSEAFVSGTSRFVQANKHAMASEFMVSLLSAIHFLVDQCKFARLPGAPPSPGGSDDLALPWDNIYPKSKDGYPSYNSSGKYIVKLFWLGSWRKVTIDDRVPVDASGKPLLLVSCNSNEIWPMLIAKALLKLAMARFAATGCLPTSFKEDADYCEFGDFDILTALRGWIPERIPLLDNLTPQIANVLAAILPKKRMRSGTIRAGSFMNMLSPSPSQSKPNSLGSGNTASPLLAGKGSGTFVFVYRDSREYNTRSVNFGLLPVPYRIVDFQRGNGIGSTLFQIRPYFSVGSKKSGELEYPDQWLTLDEISHVFPYLVIYHLASSFKLSKTISNIADPAKPVDTLKSPLILYTPEDATLGSESGFLVMLSTFGRVLAQSSGMTNVIAEEYSWNGTLSNGPAWRMTSNGVSSTFMTPTPGVGYRLAIDGPSPFVVTIFSKEDFYLEDEAKFLQERNSVKMREFEDTLPAQTAGSWSILLKHVLMVNEPMFLAANLYGSEQLLLSSSLRVINNDNGAELPQTAFNLRPQWIPPSKTGYTLIGESRAQQARQACKWKVRLFSETLSPTLVDKELWLSKMTIQDISETYVPNKHHVLFRSLLRVKDAPTNNISIQTSFSLSNVWMDLVLFDNDTVIASATGKGMATIYSAILQLSEEPTVSKQTKEDKKGNQAPAAPVAPKHRYVLQASIPPAEAEKLTNPLYNDPNRPNSRGKQTNSAGKKKKAVASAGQPTPGPTTPAGGMPGQSAAPVSPEVEFTWNLRLISSDGATVLVSKDTEKEDRYRAIKEGWEAASPGRMNKAKEHRDFFVKGLEIGQLKPLVISTPEKQLRPWVMSKESCLKVQIVPEKINTEVFLKPQALKSSRPPSAMNQPATYEEPLSSLIGKVVDRKDTVSVLQSEDFDLLSKSRQQAVVTFGEMQAEIAKRRQSEKERRGESKKILIEIAEEKMKDLEYWQHVDQERREQYRQYRQRILAEKEEEAKAKAQALLEASKAAESALEAEDANDKRKKALKK